ncbi:MAG: mismatch-specific DNA-glycosylase [Acidimicrobiia bacterium]|nr:mismatch-specific DNA-glycosylase [Acidimicrobiia bacterium]
MGGTLRRFGDVEPADVPAALAAMHRRLAVGTTVELEFDVAPSGARTPTADRRWPIELAEALVEGAGFDEITSTRLGGIVGVRARRARSLADTVGGGLRLLICGLNPSLYAADRGVAFARPGNRFWNAVVAAGVDSVANRPDLLLQHHGIGLTDLVKRATARADELDRSEYEHGLQRIERLVGWLRPGAVCFVGLAGWRAVVDRRASAGPATRRLGGAVVYVMPSTSGLNASSTPASLAAHLRAALALADGRDPAADPPDPDQPL